MSPLISEIRRFIETHQLISRKDYILAAVSGGMDSMVMLEILNQLKTELDFHLGVVHVNHHVRGDDAQLDQKLVAGYCREKGLTLTVEHLSGLDAHSSEDELRSERYKAFEIALRKQNASRLATGHHLQDQLETFLMRLSKGASQRGLTAIPVKRGVFIRPLLETPKTEIENFVRQREIPFREDQTNLDRRKLRNRIRHDLLPVMEYALGDGMVAGFKKSLNSLSAVYQAYLKRLHRVFESLIIRERASVHLKLADYWSLERIERRHLIEYCIYSIYNLYSVFEENTFIAFETFLTSAKTGGRFTLSNQIQVEKDRDVLSLYQLKNKENSCAELNLDRSVKIGRNIIRMNRVSLNDLMWNDSRNVEFISGDNIKPPLMVRTWKRGDRFVPLGTDGEQKLSDFFINNKVPRFMKDQIPLVCDQQNIIWIAGYRIDERYKVEHASKTVFRLTIEKDIENDQ